MDNRVSQKTLFFKFCFQTLTSGANRWGEPPIFFPQNYRPINKSLPAVFVFWPFKRVKRAPNGSKNMIFKNWLDTRPKMETHDPNVYPTILGGVSRGFWTPFLNCPFSRAKKWHFERPDLRTESKNLVKHPPKWLCRHLGHAFPFLGEYQANF